MNLIAQNILFMKKYIFIANNLDDKYAWLKNKFKRPCIYLYKRN